jgi:hypothetical protein
MKRMLRAATGPGGSDRPKTDRANVNKKQSGTPAQRSIFCNKGMFIRNAAAHIGLGGQQNKGAARKGKRICQI